MQREASVIPCGADRERLLARIRRLMSARLAAFHEPEDVLQEVLLAAVESGVIDRIGSRAEFRGWLVARARHRILNLAHGLRPRTRPRHGAAMPCSEFVLDKEGLRHVAQGSLPRWVRDEAQGLRGSLNRLSQDQRMVVVLRDYLGVSWSTASLILGSSTGTARKVHQRARNHLRELRGARGRWKASP